MDLKKKLLLAGFGAALGALPMAALADLSVVLADSEGVAVTAGGVRDLGNQMVELTEEIDGVLGLGTLVLKLGGSAEFVSADVSKSGGINLGHVEVNDGLLSIPITGNDGEDDREGKIKIRQIKINVPAEAAGEIKLSKDDSSNVSGSRFDSVTIAVIEEPNVTINPRGNVPNFKGGESKAIPDIHIEENVEGAIADASGNNEIVMTLPSGWLFDSNSNQGNQIGTIETNNPNEKGQRTMTIDVTKASTGGKGDVILGGGTEDMKIKAPASVEVGPVNATITVKLSNGETAEKEIQIANVTLGGVTATVVANTTDSFTTSPTALKDENLPTSAADRRDVKLASIMVVEQLGDDLQEDDTLTLTLPNNVTFAGNWDAVDSQLESRHSRPGPPYNTTTVRITDVGGPNRGGILMSNIVVDIADAEVGDIEATLTGTINGTEIKSIKLTIGKVVGTGTTTACESGGTIPTIGIGMSGPICNNRDGKLIISESVAGSIEDNRDIILTLPANTSWGTVPTVTATSDLTLGTPIINSENNRQVIIPIRDSSETGPAKITISGANVVKIGAGFSPGDVKISVGGNAGVNEAEVLVAKAALVTTTTVENITTLSQGSQNQPIGTIKIIEGVAGALKAGGKFRILLPNNLAWATNTVPTVPTTAHNGERPSDILTNKVDMSFDGNNDSGNFWEFEVINSARPNDTLVVKVPDKASKEPTVVPLTNLRVDVYPGAQVGTTVDVNIWDTDAGLLTSNQIVACIGSCGEPPAADKTNVSVSEGGEATVTFTGGMGALSIKTAPNADVATAVLNGKVLTITGLEVPEGVDKTTSVVVSDSSGRTVTVNITVIKFTVEPTTLQVGVGQTMSATITGGTAPYTPISSDETVATVSVSPTEENKIIVTGVAAGEATITVTDSGGDTVDVSVTVPVLKDFGSGGIDVNGNPVDTSSVEFWGGASGDDFGSVSDTFASNAQIDVKFEITVADDDVGEAGSLYIVAALQVPGGSWFWYFNGGEENGWVQWNAPYPLGDRVPYEEVEVLEKTHEVIVIENLTGFPGSYLVFAAYENAEGMIYLNETPLSFTVEASVETQ